MGHSFIHQVPLSINTCLTINLDVCRNHTDPIIGLQITVISSNRYHAYNTLLNQSAITYRSSWCRTKYTSYSCRAKPLSLSSWLRSDGALISRLRSKCPKLWGRIQLVPLFGVYVILASRPSVISPNSGQRWGSTNQINSNHYPERFLASLNVTIYTITLRRLKPSPWTLRTWISYKRGDGTNHPK